MSKVLAALLGLTALGLLIPLYGMNDSEEVTLLEGSAPISGLTFTQPVLETPQTDGSDAQGVSSLNAGEETFSPLADALEIEEKEPTQACAIFGPFPDTRLTQFHKDMERLGITSHFLIQSASPDTTVTLVTQTFSGAAALNEAKAALDAMNVKYQEKSQKGRPYLELGLFATQIKAELALNALKMKAPALPLGLKKKEALSAEPLSEITFLNMSESQFSLVQSFVKKHGFKLRACPY